MKKVILMPLAAVAVICASFISLAGDDRPAGKVVAYYFHGAFRCPTCTAMEKYSREAVETNFRDALASGKLEFKAINVEDRGNEHFVVDYQLYTKSLILSFVKDGKEIRSKNLNKIWDYARNKQMFINYVAGEVNGFLKDAQ